MKTAPLSTIPEDGMKPLNAAVQSGLTLKRMAIKTPRTQKTRDAMRISKTCIDRFKARAGYCELCISIHQWPTAQSTYVLEENQNQDNIKRCQDNGGGEWNDREEPVLSKF